MLMGSHEDESEVESELGEIGNDPPALNVVEAGMDGYLREGL